MSEVKVRITAQNETQTGFQSVLSDAKKTATQVQQTFSKASSSPIATGQNSSGGSILFGPDMSVDDWVAQAERNIEENLKKRKALREAMKETASAGANAGGAQGPMGGGLLRWTGIVTTAVTAGVYFKKQLEEVAREMNGLTDATDNFIASAVNIGNATSISELVSGLKNANSEFSALERQAQDFKKGFWSNLVNIGSLGSFFNTINDNLESAGNLRGLEAELAISRQIKDIREQTAARESGKNVDDVKTKQNNARIREEFRKSLPPENRQRALARFDALIAAQENDRSVERQQKEAELNQLNQQRADAEAQRNAEKLAVEQQRTAQAREKIDKDIAMADAKLRGDKRTQEDLLQKQDMQNVLDSGGSFEQASNFTSINALQRQVDAQIAAEKQNRFQGSKGASSLQRIGFASNEYFDTRQTKDPSQETARLTEVAKQILKKIENGQVLLAN